MPESALELLQQVAGDRDLAGSVLERAQLAERLQEAAERREAEREAARRAENREMAMIADRMVGGAQEHVRACQLKAADLADEVADLEARLEKARARQQANADQLRWWGERGMLAAESASRSQILDPYEQASMRAADALREAHEGRALMERLRREARQRSRGLSRRSAVQEPAQLPGGVDVRIRSGGYVVDVY